MTIPADLFPVSSPGRLYPTACGGGCPVPAPVVWRAGGGECWSGHGRWGGVKSAINFLLRCSRCQAPSSIFLPCIL
jgi:hypothetical protein